MKRKNNLTGSPAVLKQINRVRLLGILFRERMASRAQLARKTGLDAKTITNISNSLLDDNLIECGGIEVTGRGRPAANLMLNADAAYALGVDVGAQQITTILVNFRGDITWKGRYEFAAFQPKEYILKTIKSSIESGLTSLDRNLHDKIKGIGICVPGLLDRGKGVVRHSVNIPSCNNMAICSLLEEWFGYPAVLEEASRSMALGEMWFGNRKHSDDFICIDLGFGIGMGIINNGLLHRGAYEASGELGHMTVDAGGLDCECGKKGCLETFASGRALAEIAETVLSESPDADANGAKLLYKAALNGNQKSRDILARSGRNIGMVIANVINLFDPGAVIINGGLTEAGALLMDPLQSAIKEYALLPVGKRCRVDKSHVGLHAGALGAAMLLLKNNFQIEDIRF